MQTRLASLALASVVLLSIARPAAAEELAAPGPRAAEPAPLPSDIGVTRIKSKGLVIGGSILAGVGVGLGIAGASLLANASNYACPVTTGYGALGCAIGASVSGSARAIVGGGLLGGGFLFAAAGVPMVVVGAGKKAPAGPQVVGAMALPEVRVGPASGSLKWAF